MMFVGKRERGVVWREEEGRKKEKGREGERTRGSEEEKGKGSVGERETGRMETQRVQNWCIVYLLCVPRTCHGAELLWRKTLGAELREELSPHDNDNRCTKTEDAKLWK